MAFIEASLEELPVSANLGQSCLATKINTPGPSILGGSATARVEAEAVGPMGLVGRPVGRSACQVDQPPLASSSRLSWASFS